MTTTVQKWGNSLGIRIPKSVAEQAEMSAGTVVQFDTSDGVLTVRPKRVRSFRLSALLAQAKGPSPHRRLVRDRAMGRELL